MSLESRFSPSRGNTGLPVSAERVNPNNILQNERDLPRFNLDVDPAMSRLVPVIIQELVVEIQNNSDRSELRTFAMNLFGHNGFANEYFADLAQLFANYVEYVAVRDRADPAGVIKGELEPFVTAATAYLVEMFPALGDYVPNEYAPEVRRTLGEWNEMVRQVQGYLRQVGGSQQPAYRPRGLGGARDREPTGMNGGMYNRSGGRRLGGGGAQDLRPNWEMNDNDGGGQTRREGGPSTGLNAGAGLLRSRAERESSGEVLARGATPSSVGMQSGVQSRMPQVETRPLQRQEEPKAAGSAKFDRVEFKDGRVAVPAFKSGWKVTYSPERPPLVFNHETHVLYHVRDKDGHVTEELIEMTPEMEYLRHELDEKLRETFKANDSMFDTTVNMPQILETRRLIPNAAGTIATQVSEERRKELDAADAPRVITRPLQAASLEEAHFLAQTEAFREPGESEFLEYQVEETRETNLSSGALKVVLGLRESKSLDDLHTQLTQLHRTDLIDDAFMQLLDRRMTMAFNRFMRKQLYLGYSIDSFVNDYEELKTLVRNETGQPTLDRLLNGYKTIIQRAMSVLTGERLSKYLGNLSEEARKALDEPAIFTNRYSVTELPWTALDMASAWRTEGVVTTENAKEFHQALSAVFGRTRTNDVHEHLLVTSDGKLIYAYEGVLMPNTFTVTMDPPVLDTSFFTAVKALA